MDQNGLAKMTQKLLNLLPIITNLWMAGLERSVTSKTSPGVTKRDRNTVLWQAQRRQGLRDCDWVA